MMPTIRVSKGVLDELGCRKLSSDESWNDVVRRLVDNCKIYRVNDILVEVKGDGTIVTAGSPVCEKVMQD